MNKKMLSLACLISLCACRAEPPAHMPQDAPVFSLLPAAQTGIDFRNTAIEKPDRHLGHYDYFYNGSGVAIGDVNNDGKPDIYFAGNHRDNTLYLNQGELKFVDVGAAAGVNTDRWSTGVTMVDINEDGWLDIYVCNSGPYIEDEWLRNELYINNGDGTFSEQAQAYGIADLGYSSQAAFFDMDGDGDLDLFVMNHSLLSYGKTIQSWEARLNALPPEQQKKSSSSLYRNEGNGKFVDITNDAGVYRLGFGLGLSISDLNEDGLLDIYVANDYFIPDFLYINQGDGRFAEQIKDSLAHSAYYAMGSDAADINNDGLVDLAVLDMSPADHVRSKTLMESMDVPRFSYLANEKDYLPQYMYNVLNLNRGRGQFSEIAQFSGIAQTDWSWAALLVDLDNDSWKDLIVSNGFKRDTKNQDWLRALEQRSKTEDITEEIYFQHLQKADSKPIANYVFRNKADLRFENVSEAWGFSQPSFSHGTAYGDLDADGDLDVVINNLESSAFVYRNNTADKATSHFVQFSLSDGSRKAPVMHAKIKVFADGQSQLLEYSFVRGYLSSMQELAHFGLGSHDKIERVEIIWPDGQMSAIAAPAVDQHHHIDRQKIAVIQPSPRMANPLFQDISAQTAALNYSHLENDFDDFAQEVLLPHKQSSLGPAIAVGDLNGDGLEDFFIGAAKGQAGRLHLQQDQSTFGQGDQTVFIQDKQAEDLGALFFDADQDGDLDLYVASGGGGEFSVQDPLLQDRLYLNDGHGQLSKAVEALPAMLSSTAAVSAQDWDSDGDLDLFVGGRTTPGQYPVAPRSYLLLNDNGQFTDQTSILAPQLSHIGLVTAALWSDMDGDKRQDLLLVGEWMPITVFLNKPDGFVEATEDFGFAHTNGWWYSLGKADFDGDGDEDFIAGNIGLNNKFHPSKSKPLHVYTTDFDDSGSLDIVLSKTYKGQLVPVRGKECSTQQMPFIAEKIPTFSAFATSSLQEIYGKNRLSQALHYQAFDFASYYIENKGKGHFQLRPLPTLAQLAPINGMAIWDFDQDGIQDLVIAGNKYNTEVETPAYDAGKGLFLKGRGDGTFQAQRNIAASGISISKNAKDLQLIFQGPDRQPAVLAAHNDAPPQLFKWARPGL